MSPGGLPFNHSVTESFSFVSVIYKSTRLPSLTDSSFLVRSQREKGHNWKSSERTHTHTHTHARTHTTPHTHTRTHAHDSTHARTHARTHTLLCTDDRTCRGDKTWHNWQMLLNLIDQLCCMVATRLSVPKRTNLKETR